MTNGAINITLNATPELIGVIRTLAEALTGRPVSDTRPIAEPVGNNVVPETVVQAPVNPAPIAMTPVAPAPAAPVNPVPVTAAPSYTLDALARAGAVLAQSGKMEQALALLAKYNVQTVNQLKPEQYGAFATELRALGAQL